MNDIDQHGVPNESFKVRVKNDPGATTEDICNPLKSKIRKKPNVVIIHAGTNDLTNDSKSLKNYMRVADLVRSKLPNCKLAISKVITRKDKKEIEKKWRHSTLNLPNFAKITK